MKFPFIYAQNYGLISTRKVKSLNTPFLFD